MGRPPWMAKNQIDLARQITNIELSFPVNVDPHLKVVRFIFFFFTVQFDLFLI
jgi:hypothetical protein